MHARASTKHAWTPPRNARSFTSAACRATPAATGRDRRIPPRLDVAHPSPIARITCRSRSIQLRDFDRVLESMQHEIGAQSVRR
jgi:hypothetical protein